MNNINNDNNKENLDENKAINHENDENNEDLSQVSEISGDNMQIDDDIMYDEKGKAIQVTAKTSLGNKNFFSSLPGGSNHEKITLLRKEYEKAEEAKMTSLFADNVAVIENCLDSIKSQVKAMSDGIASEELRYKNKYLVPIKDQIEHLKVDLDERDELNSILDRLTAENTQLRSKLEKADVIVEKSAMQIEVLGRKVNELNSENNVLLRAKSKFDDDMKQKEDQLKLQIEEKSSRIRELDKKCSTQELKIEQYEKLEKDLQEDIRNLKVSHLNEINTLHESAMNSERSLNSKITELNVDIQNLKIENKDISSQIEKLDDEKETLIVENKNLKTEKNNANKDVERLSLENKTFEVEVSQLKKALEVEETEVKNLNKRIETYNNDKQRYLNDIDNLNEKLREEVNLRGEREIQITKNELMYQSLESKYNELVEKYNALLSESKK